MSDFIYAPYLPLFITSELVIPPGYDPRPRIVLHPAEEVRERQYPGTYAKYKLPRMRGDEQDQVHHR